MQNNPTARGNIESGQVRSNPFVSSAALGLPTASEDRRAEPRDDDNSKDDNVDAGIRESISAARHARESNASKQHGSGPQPRIADGQNVIQHDPEFVFENPMGELAGKEMQGPGHDGLCSVPGCQAEKHGPPYGVFCKTHLPCTKLPGGTRTAAFSAVPSALGKKWLAQTMHPTIPRSSKEYIRCRDAASNKFERIIERDVTRTSPTHEYFKNGPGIGQLRSVLKAFSNYDPRLGYVQGMNFLVGYLLRKLRSEEDAFWIFVGIVQIPRYDLGGLFALEFPKMYCGAYQLDRLMRRKTPRLHRHLALFDVKPSLYLCKWWLTLYNHLSSQTVHELIWDQFMEGGWTQVLRLTLAFLQDVEPQVLQRKDFGNIVTYLTNDMWGDDYPCLATVQRAGSELRSEIRDREFDQLEMEYLLMASTQNRANVLSPLPASSSSSSSSSHRDAAAAHRRGNGITRRNGITARRRSRTQ